MSDDKFKKNLINQLPPKRGYDPDEEDDSGDSGKGGQIEFRDFLSTGDSFEKLPPEELRRLLAVHADEHESRVKKQKELDDFRNDLRDGKIPMEDYRQGMGAGNSEYAAHPVLSAKFSGADPQVISLPSENQANTNEGDRNELQQEYKLRYAPQFTPTFNPKPTIYNR